MLIIGDAALKELKKDHDIVDVEIISTGEQINYVENVMNTSKQYNILNNYTKSYILNSKRTLLLYNSNELHILDKILDYTFSNKCKFVYAPAKILYVIEYIKVTEMFHDVYYWEKSVKNFNYLLKQHILPMQKQEDRLIKKLELYSVKFYSFVLNHKSINNTYYKYREFDTFKEEDLYNIFSYNRKNTFNNVSFASNRTEISMVKWKSYTLEEKLGAVLERAYTVAVNDFVIPYWLEYKKMPLNTRELFKKALMIIVSTSSTDVFAMFIILHYNIILSKFNRYFINIFSNAMKYGDIEQIN